MDLEKAKEEIKEWFLDNFYKPEEPYRENENDDSDEPEYEFGNGPYYCKNELYEQFKNAYPEDFIFEVAEEIEEEEDCLAWESKN
ncbi:MAG: hypothetical protein QNJ31_00960 [Candidatus Caenarcaniphilales bacterium]|nr:hypothetical protein [Candidatus Caenarcaniphilales bacterium]